MSFHDTHHLYHIIAIPEMLYAVDIWYTPKHHSHAEQIALGLVGTVNKLTKVQ